MKIIEIVCLIGTLFINLYIICIISKHIRIVYALEGSSKNILKNTAITYHNLRINEMKRNISLFWFSIMLFLSGIYFITIRKYKLLSNNFLLFLITLCYIVTFLNILKVSYDYNEFSSKYLQKYSKYIDVI